LYGNASDPSSEAVSVWEVEFWNRAVNRVYTFGNREPVGPETLVNLDPRTGRISAGEASTRRKLNHLRALLTDTGTDMIGRRAGTQGPFDLYLLRSAPRIASSVAGITADGWMSSDATFRQFDATRQGSVSVTLSRAAWSGPDVPGKVVVSISPAGRGPASKRLTLHSRETRVVALRTPRHPFSVAVHVEPTFSPSQFGGADIRQLGAQVSFRFNPNRWPRSCDGLHPD
jgi:hypothetical protein